MSVFDIDKFGGKKDERTIDGLNAKQQDILVWIAAKTDSEDHGSRGVEQKEIKEMFDFASIPATHYNVSKLEDMGLITSWVGASKQVVISKKGYELVVDHDLFAKHDIIEDEIRKTDLAHRLEKMEERLESSEAVDIERMQTIIDEQQKLIQQLQYDLINLNKWVLEFARNYNAVVNHCSDVPDDEVFARKMGYDEEFYNPMTDSVYSTPSEITQSVLEDDKGDE